MPALSDLPLRRWRWLAPIPASCLLQTLFGLNYANGVFVALLDQPEYTLSIGIVGFFIAAGITAFGVVMNKFVPPDHYQSAPVYVSLIGSLGLACQALMAYALSIHNTALLFFAAVLLGSGSGCLYVASVDVLQAWVPESPGMVTGVGMLCGGAGSLFGVYAFGVFAHFFNGAIPAMAFVGAVSGILAFMASVLVRRPPPNWRPEDERNHFFDGDIIANESMKLLTRPSSYTVYPTLSVRDILTDPAFYLLLVAFAATVGPGFGFVLGFQRMCADMFAIENNAANKLFFWVTLTGVAGRFFSGVGIDALESGSTNEIGLHGARRTNIILLLGQTLALILIPYFIRKQFIYCFTIATSMVYLAFSGGSVVAACLVRGIFKPNNASLSFSLVAVSIGVGDVFFSWVIARCGEYSALQRIVHDVAPEFHRNDYNLFFSFGILWSILGLLATAFIRISDKVAVEEQKVLPFAHTLWSD